MADRTSDSILEELVADAVDGDQRAWGTLWQALEPRLLGLIRRPQFSGPLSARDDDCRNIALAVMARLRDDDYRRLRGYLEAKRTKPGLKLMPWLIVMTKRVTIDYLRSSDQYVDRRRDADASAPGQWIDNEPLPPPSRSGGQRPPFTRRGTAREILSYCGHELATDQRAALELWTEGASSDDIASALALPDANAATRLVRAALARLRRHFRDADSG